MYRVLLSFSSPSLLQPSSIYLVQRWPGSISCFFLSLFCLSVVLCVRGSFCPIFHLSPVFAQIYRETGQKPSCKVCRMAFALFLGRSVSGRCLYVCVNNGLFGFRHSFSYVFSHLSGHPWVLPRSNFTSLAFLCLWALLRLVPAPPEPRFQFSRTHTTVFLFHYTAGRFSPMYTSRRILLSPLLKIFHYFYQ